MRRWILLFLFLVSCQQKPATQSAEIKDIIPKNQYAMLIVESERCIYCKQLKRDLQSQTLAQELSGLDVYSVLYDSNSKVRYILGGKEHISTEEELSKALKVKSVPHIFFYDKEGKIVLEILGYQPPKTLACSIRYVKEEKYKEVQYMDYMRSERCL